MKPDPATPADRPQTLGVDATQSNGKRALKHIRRAVIFVLGMSVVLVGVVMMVTPGPAFIVIPVGLAILATEFLWARRILDSAKKRFEELRNGQGKQAKPSPSDSPAA